MKRLLKRILLTLCALIALTSLVLLPLSHYRRLYIGWQRLEQGTYPDNHAVELFVTAGSLAFDFIARDTFWLSTYQLTPPDWWDRRGFYAGADAARPISSFSPPDAFSRLGTGRAWKQPLACLTERHRKSGDLAALVLVARG